MLLKRAKSTYYRRGKRPLKIDKPNSTTKPHCNLVFKVSRFDIKCSGVFLLETLMKIKTTMIYKCADSEGNVIYAAIDLLFDFLK